MSLRIGDIEQLFRDHGHIAYSGEGVSQLEHALQTARRADVEQFVARRTAPLARALGQLTVAQRSGFLAGLRAWASAIEV